VDDTGLAWRNGVDLAAEALHDAPIADNIPVGPGGRLDRLQAQMVFLIHRVIERKLIRR
jgi:hypothetical protein